MTRDSSVTTWLSQALLDELCRLFERLGETRVAETIELRAAGFTLEQISLELKVSVATVRRILRLMEERLKRELAPARRTVRLIEPGSAVAGQPGVRAVRVGMEEWRLARRRDVSRFRRRRCQGTAAL